MAKLVAVKSLVGFNYVRPDMVVAITSTDPSKCTIYVQGGVDVPANEPPAAVIAKLEAAEAESNTES